MAKKKKTGQTILWIVFLFISAAMAGIGLAIAGMTLASLWKGAVIGLLLAAISFPAFFPIWHKIIPDGKLWHYAIGQAILVGSLGFMLMFGLNYWFADKDSCHTVEAHIVAKFQQEHNRTRRSGRRYIPSGEKWYSYHVTIELPDGRRKNRKVPVSQYLRLRTGSKIDIEIEKGLFGMDIIRPVD